MKHRAWAVALLVLLASPLVARASSMPPSLDQLLSVVRMHHPTAMVSSGFHDWRTVSRYRAVAGLHAGYDIALPAGAVVPAAWPGTVVSVTPWAEDEWGITVESGAFRATYGHLRPLVRVGDSVGLGEALGAVARDHVDVKVRDAAGRFVDIGSFHLARTQLQPRLVVQRAQRWRKAARRELLAVERELAGRTDGEGRLRVEASEMQWLLEQGAVSRDEAGAASAEWRAYSLRSKWLRARAVAIRARVSLFPERPAQIP